MGFPGLLFSSLVPCMDILLSLNQPTSFSGHNAMSKNVELDVAQATLSELVAGLTPDDDIVIMKDCKPVAKLVATSVVRPPRIPGMMKGKLTILAEDDEHLKDFAE